MNLRVCRVLFYADISEPKTLVETFHGTSLHPLNERYCSEIHLVETNKRQRQPRSTKYRQAWELILPAALDEEKCVCSPVEDGKAEF